MNRQDFLKTLGLGTVVSVTGSSLLTGCNTHDMSGMNMTPGMENMGPSVTEIPFSTPLRFPETITGTGQLTAKSVSDAILPGKNARVLGYRGGMTAPKPPA